jgi:hypothetical protein
MITGCGPAVRLLGVSSLNLGRAVVWPNFFACLECRIHDPDRSGHRVQDRQSGDLIVDRWRTPAWSRQTSWSSARCRTDRAPECIVPRRRTKLRGGISSPLSHQATSADSNQATTSGELSATDWRRPHHLPQSYNQRFHRNRPIPKSADGLQQIFSVRSYLSLGQRSRPSARSAPVLPVVNVP